MERGEIAFPDEIRKMKLGDIVRMANDEFTAISRVPGGWIYKFFEPCHVCEACNKELEFLGFEKKLPLKLICAQFVPEPNAAWW